jgi:hypothetical protein
MTRHALLCLVFLSSLATVGFAQTADLSVSVTAPATIDPRGSLSWTVVVTNAGPDAAHGVTVTGTVTPTTAVNCSPSTFAFLAPNTHISSSCFTRPALAAGDLTISTTVSHSGTDPNPSNNTASAVVKSIIGPALSVSLTVPPYLDPGLPFDIGVRVFNSSDLPAHDTTLTVDVPRDMPIVKVPENCTVAGTRVTCSLGTMPPDSSVSTVPPPLVTFTVIAGTVSNTGYETAFAASVSTSDPEGYLDNNHTSVLATVYRMFWVDGTPSSVGGELQFAINNVNRDCTSDRFPCKIGFRLTGQPEAGGFYRIPLFLPLPKITARSVVVDGTTQARYVGDTNPGGPEIFIDGSRLGPTMDGFTLASGCTEITSLAIGNFGGAAIVALTPADSAGCAGGRTIHDNYIGVDPTGTTAAPNGRGIFYADRAFFGPTVFRNVISGNKRSGIFVATGTATSIHDNKIGLDAKGNPLGNGGSGIYVGPDVNDVDIRANFIAFNHEFGVAVDNKSIGTDVAVNSIYANWQMGIDRGLDGPTADPLLPVITSAVYDAASDTTSITASITATSSVVGPDLNFYASDAPHSSGRGEGQYFLGHLRVNSGRAGTSTVTFPAKGDWRGKWVSMTFTANSYYGFILAGVTPASESPDTHSTTSEFSVAVKVE